MDPKQHTYVVKWLTEDQACVEVPSSSLSWLRANRWG